VKDTIILGIETSCDETSVAVVRNGKEILSNLISSQVDIHKKFGGVVPEVASRQHVEVILPIMEEALAQAGVGLHDVDAIAVTYGPGLVGALLIGLSAAKAISYAADIPLIGVHHIAGHIYANRFVQDFDFPLIALVVSGGHTELVWMKEHGAYEVIGGTRDDAVGEAYDKVARSLGLSYPGGPEIDRLASEGKDILSFPRVYLEPESFDFSFSGLKSAVLNRLNQASQKGEELSKADVAASFQAAVVEVLVDKTIRSARERGAKQVLLAGGVAANRALRAELNRACAKEGIPLIIPPASLCTDNAAMIAAAGQILYEKGMFAPLDLNAYPNLKLE
jgi:N6-L-threonylcarbamoyladenine synthase